MQVSQDYEPLNIGYGVQIQSHPSSIPLGAWMRLFVGCGK